MALSHNDLVENIAEVLRATDGGYLAQIYNQICSDKVAYLGDSLFENVASPELSQETLEGVGYEFSINGENGRWSWSAITDDSGTSFTDKEGAVAHAWADAAQQTQAILSLSAAEFEQLSSAGQAQLIADNLREI